MLAEQLTEAFRDEHRHMRDVLLALMDAFQSSDAEAIRKGVDEMTSAAGPHFHYEGSALYPALAQIYGDEYVDRLRAEHEEAIAAARELAALADLAEVTPEAADYGVELIRGLLPHVSDRDGLSVIVEVLEPEQIQSILEARRAARGAKVTLEEAGKRARRRAVKTKGRGRASKAVPIKVQVKAAKRARKAPKRRARAK